MADDPKRDWKDLAHLAAGDRRFFVQPADYEVPTSSPESRLEPKLKL
jgi:hypothetical protein